VEDQKQQRRHRAGVSGYVCPGQWHVLDEDFNWDVQGNNLFDKKAKLLFPEGSQITVTTAGLSGNCDLTITFSNGLCLESFVNASSQEECWRLFMPGLEHGDLVVTGVGIEHC